MIWIILAVIIAAIAILVWYTTKKAKSTLKATTDMYKSDPVLWTNAATTLALI